MVVLTVLVFVIAASCGDPATVEDRSRQQASQQVVPIENVAAMTVLADGMIVAGDRLTGLLYLVDPSPTSATADGRSRTVARIEVSTEGQQGLLGLAADQRYLYAAWTTRDQARMVVGRFLQGDLSAANDGEADGSPPSEAPSPTVVWNGFVASTGANGGHLDLLPDGRVVLGVGTLRNSRLIDDPGTVNGKLLALDPDGPQDQEPTVVSSGWRNPFAFVVSPPSASSSAAVGSAIWVADNEPEDGSAERVGRGDEPGRSLTELETSIAPAALVRLPDGDLGVCGYLTGIMQRIDIGDGRAGQPGDRVVGDCNQAAVVLDDGRLVTSDGSRLVIHSGW